MKKRNETFGGTVKEREFPVLQFLIRMRRNHNFYTFMLIIPSVLLSALTMVVFWLPPESPAKMMLGELLSIGHSLLRFFSSQSKDNTIFL